MDQGLAERRFRRIVNLFVAVGFAAVLFAGITAAVVMTRGQEIVASVEHTYEVERQVTSLRLSLEEMRSARRGVVLKLINDSGSTYDAAVARLYAAIENVARLTTDNPVQQHNVAELRKRAGRLDARFRASMVPGFVSSAGNETTRQGLAGEVEGIAERMLAQERALLSDRQQAQRASVASLYLIAIVAAVLLVLVGFGSLWVIRRYTGELNVSRAQLQRLNEDLEGAVAERTVDLQRANDEIQRFAYIVSHDLRSPLVNVMGFTSELDAAIKPLSTLVDTIEAQAPEMITSEARDAVRTDLPEAVGFIRTSTQKMDRLINAILRLSREGRRPITPEPIDIGQLARSVVDGVQHRIDELGIEIEIGEAMPTVITDRLAIEQILSNLVENAIKYRHAERTGYIRISAAAQHGRVVIDVADNGRGIERRDHERIFDLFRRSGVQDQAGEGIGLAHVRALAYRLGGTISVESDLGKGATFRINLPLVFSSEKGGDDA